jgi:hydroxypyruvate isomerase
MNPPMKEEFSSDRRRFLLGGTALTGALAIGSKLMAQTPEGAGEKDRPAKFSLRFAPHPGTFKAHAGNDIIDQIRFAAEQGFTAWEDNGLPGRPPELQEKIGAALREHGMTMGVFVAYGNFDEPVFVRSDHPKRDEVLAKMKQAVEICKRVGAKWFTVVPGSVDQQHKDGKWNQYGGSRLRVGVQTANAIDLLRRCAEILEPDNLVMVLEPLNWEANHGGVFLRSTDQAYALCKAVNSPSCKILYDIYHEQITAGNLISTFDQCLDEIAYVQAGDNPGRKEPGTGEINYSNVFRHIARVSREFVIGMEHGNSKPGKEGEEVLIKAYREVDPG